MQHMKQAIQPGTSESSARYGLLILKVGGSGQIDGRVNLHRVGLQPLSYNGLDSLAGNLAGGCFHL